MAACDTNTPTTPATDLPPSNGGAHAATPVAKSSIVHPIKGAAITEDPSQFQALGNTTQATAWYYFQSPSNNIWYIVDLSGHIYSLDAVGAQYTGGIGWRPINQTSSAGYPSAGANFTSVSVSSDGRSVSIGSAVATGLPVQATALQNTTQAVAWLYFEDSRGWWYITEAGSASQVLLLADADPSIAGGIGWQPVYNSTYPGYPSAGQTFSSVSLGSGRRSTVFGAPPATTGSINVTIAGLPSGASGTVLVSGQSYSGNVFHSTTMANVRRGRTLLRRSRSSSVP